MGLGGGVRVSQPGPVGDAAKLLRERVRAVECVDEPWVGGAHACGRVRPDVELRGQHVVVLGGVAPHQRRKARHVVPGQGWGWGWGWG